MASGIPIGGNAGFVVLPPLYCFFLVMMKIGYILLTQVAKAWLIREYKEEELTEMKEEKRSYGCASPLSCKIE